MAYLHHNSQRPVINNLNSLLDDIYVRFVELKEDDFRLHYKVFDVILQKLHSNMKYVDNYYNRYSSAVQVSGSHYDGVRIKKPDEFDVVFNIGMPLNIRVNQNNPADSDIILEDMTAGYIKLKMGAQFQNLPRRDDWHINKTLYEWQDNYNYLLRSKFSDWFKSVVIRGLNQFGNNRTVVVDGVQYTIGVSETGPAMTLKISGNYDRFKMDVDLVPALKFPENRWPNWSGYRVPKPPYSNDFFLVVPKLIKKKNVRDVDESRSWRLSMLHQENQILRGTYNLRHTIRFLKKLRDEQDMHHIASYYLKNLVLLEAIKHDNKYWQQAPSALFVMMVKKLKEALEARNIPYFWNPKQNLLENVEDNIIAGYAAKMKRFVQILEHPHEYPKVANYLLTRSELAYYSHIL